MNYNRGGHVPFYHVSITLHKFARIVVGCSVVVALKVEVVFRLVSIVPPEVLAEVSEASTLIATQIAEVTERAHGLLGRVEQALENITHDCTKMA